MERCCYCGKEITQEETRYTVTGEPYGTECLNEEIKAQGMEEELWNS